MNRHDPRGEAPVRAATPQPELASDPDTRIFEHVVEVSRTISEADVYTFAGVTGDLSPVHLNAEYARRLPGGQRVAHGVLIVGLMSAASSAWCSQVGLDAFSYGYDKVRFVRPVRFGDTVTVRYRLAEHAHGERRYVSDVEVVNQAGEVVAVARHILWEVRPGDDAGSAAPIPGGGHEEIR